MKLTKIQQVIIGFVIIVVAIAITQLVFLKGDHQQIDAAKAKSEELDTKIRAAEEIQQVAVQLKEEMAHLSEQLERLKKILPPSINQPKLLADIKRYANENGLEILSVINSKPVAHDMIVEHPFAFMTRGGYHDYGNFFAQLTNYQRIINVKGLRIAREKSKTGYVVGANFIISVFTYREPTEEELREQLNEKKQAKSGKGRK